jgi:hypothetical protein
MQSHPKTATAAATSASKAHTPASSRTAAAPTITPSVFDHLPDSALLRETDLVRSPKRPNATAPLPFSAATLWRMAKARQVLFQNRSNCLSA